MITVALPVASFVSRKAHLLGSAYPGASPALTLLQAVAL